MALRTLPSNFLSLLPTLSMDQVATAASIATERALASPGGSRSSSFWMARREAARAEATSRGFVIYRRAPETVYYFEKAAGR